jgi:hypothetical protein
MFLIQKHNCNAGHSTNWSIPRTVLLHNGSLKTISGDIQPTIHDWNRPNRLCGAIKDESYALLHGDRLKLTDPHSQLGFLMMFISRQRLERSYQHIEIGDTISVWKKDWKPHPLGWGVFTFFFFLIFHALPYEAFLESLSFDVLEFWQIHHEYVRMPTISDIPSYF